MLDHDEFGSAAVLPCGKLLIIVMHFALFFSHNHGWFSNWSAESEALWTKLLSAVFLAPAITVGTAAIDWGGHCSNLGTCLAHDFEALEFVNAYSQAPITATDTACGLPFVYSKVSHHQAACSLQVDAVRCRYVVMSLCRYVVLPLCRYVVMSFCRFCGRVPANLFVFRRW